MNKHWMNKWMRIYFAHTNFHARICMFTVHGVGEKEADSCIPTHHKKRNKLSTHTLQLIHWIKERQTDWFAQLFLRKTNLPYKNNSLLIIIIIHVAFLELKTFHSYFTHCHKLCLLVLLFHVSACVTHTSPTPPTPTPTPPPQPHPTSCIVQYICLNQNIKFNLLSQTSHYRTRALCKMWFFSLVKSLPLCPQSPNTLSPAALFCLILEAFLKENE